MSRFGGCANSSSIYFAGGTKYPLGNGAIQLAKLQIDVTRERDYARGQQLTTEIRRGPEDDIRPERRAEQFVFQHPILDGERASDARVTQRLECLCGRNSFRRDDQRASAAQQLRVSQHRNRHPQVDEAFHAKSVGGHLLCPATASEHADVMTRTSEMCAKDRTQCARAENCVIRLCHGRGDSTDPRSLRDPRCFRQVHRLAKVQRNRAHTSHEYYSLKRRGRIHYASGTNNAGAATRPEERLLPDNLIETAASVVTAGWYGAAVAVTIATGSFAALWVLRSIVRRHHSRMSLTDGTEILEIPLKIASRTTLPFLLVVAAYIGFAVYGVTDATAVVLLRLLTIALFWQAGLWISTLLVTWLDRRAASRTDDKAVAGSIGIIRFIARVAVWAMVLLLTLDNLGIDITALVAGLGIGGIAVALALQNVLGDLFASLSIALDQPFALGDFVVAGDHMGTVEYIGIKSTRLRSLSGEQIVMPNSDLLSSRLRNYGRMRERRVVFTLGVTYETPARNCRRSRACCATSSRRRTTPGSTARTLQSTAPTHWISKSSSTC
jgi:small-conductance mechanosensitive channel